MQATWEPGGSGRRSLQALACLVQVGLQAYLMWEQAGKPDGANFSDDARRQLEQQLQSGKSVQDLERALKSPSDQPQQQGQQPAQVTDTQNPSVYWPIAF